MLVVQKLCIFFAFDVRVISLAPCPYVCAHLFHLPHTVTFLPMLHDRTCVQAMGFKQNRIAFGQLILHARQMGCHGVNGPGMISNVF